VTDETPADTTLGQRLRRFREDKDMSLSQLARDTGLAKSYLWSLENADKEQEARPSGDTLYKIAETLGVTMSDLLGRRLVISAQPDHIDPALAALAKADNLSEAEVATLASIQWRGDQPRTVERWRWIHQAIRMSKSLDRKHDGPAQQSAKASQQVTTPGRSKKAQ
jgi:transcriptional regulator with XRE-family HTH domain